MWFDGRGPGAVPFGHDTINRRTVRRTLREQTGVDTPTAVLTLRGEHITLAQALKAVGVAGSGGQAKHLVRSGAVTVNGTVATQPGRKLGPGDRFSVAGGEWTISR